MLKVTVEKRGKKIIFNGQQIMSPCKFFINDKDQTSIKVVLKQLGVGEDFFTIEKVEDDKEKVEARAVAAKEVAKKFEQAAKEVKGEAKVEEVKAEVKVEEKKSSKKNRR